MLFPHCLLWWTSFNQMKNMQLNEKCSLLQLDLYRSLFRENKFCGIVFVWVCVCECVRDSKQLLKLCGKKHCGVSDLEVSITIRDYEGPRMRRSGCALRLLYGVSSGCACRGLPVCWRLCLVRACLVPPAKPHRSHRYDFSPVETD